MFLLQYDYDDNVNIKSESRWRFHVASAWVGNNLTLNKASFSSPCDDCTKRLTFFRMAPRLLGTHIFFMTTFLAADWVRVSFTAVWSFTVLSLLSTYLHLHSQGVDRKKEADEVNPHVVVTKSNKTLHRILMISHFNGTVWCKIPRMGQILSSDAMRTGWISWKPVLECFLKLIMWWDQVENNWLLLHVSLCTPCTQFHTISGVLCLWRSEKQRDAMNIWWSDALHTAITEARYWYYSSIIALSYSTMIPNRRCTKCITT